MKLYIEQSPEFDEVEISIKCGAIDEWLMQLIEQIRLYSFALIGRKDGCSHKLSAQELYYAESVEERTFLYCEKDVFETDQKLYELERALSPAGFVRVSKSCLLNTEQLSRVRALPGSRFEATLRNGESVVVNRHYAAGFKEKFGL